MEELHDCLKVCLKNFIFFIFYSFFWKIFKTMMLKFSTDMPCITNVIPEMDRMHADLLAACTNEDYSTAICAALKVGMDLLNKYYLITDNSKVYRIAMGMLNIFST